MIPRHQMHFFGHMVEEHFVGAKVRLIAGEHFESLFGGDLQVEHEELLWTEQPVLVPHEAFLRKIDLVNLIRAFEVHCQDVACLVLGDDPCSDHFGRPLDRWYDRRAQHGWLRALLFMQTNGYCVTKACPGTDRYRDMKVGRVVVLLMETLCSLTSS